MARPSGEPDKDEVVIAKRSVCVGKVQHRVWELEEKKKKSLNMWLGEALLGYVSMKR
jgi:hypothetical protein